MENFIRISKEQFYNRFKGENYTLVSWTRKPKDVPEPPYQEAHLDWVYDLSAKRYVGSISSSSYNDNVHYEILEELATPDMVEWYENYTVEEKAKREKFDKEMAESYAKYPHKPFDPSKPGLMEFLEEGNNIPYNPEVGIDEMVKAFESVWYDKLKEI